MEKILVTGGAGYIGSILVPKLLEKNYHVTVVDNLMYKQVSLINCFSNPNFNFVKGDICNEDLMIDHIKKADVIIPLAALVGAPLCRINPSLTKLVNYDAIEFILNNTTKSQKVIFPTTNSGYGIGEKDKYCDENTPLRPVSLYGKLKVDIEKKLLDSNRAVTFRLATVFGASSRMRIDLLVNDFTYRAVNDGFVILFQEHFKRNFIHIQDVASAFLFALDHYSEMVGQAYNIGLSDANLSKKELCERIKKNVKSFYFHAAEVGEDPDKRDYLVSNEKIEQLGWKPQMSLDAGIKELVQAYQVIKPTQFSNI